MNAKEPLVMCLSNSVAQDITANALLAIGAKPAMVEDAGEAAELASAADAVLINLGTINSVQAETMKAAIVSCKEHNIPWVLDPVACHQLAYRHKVMEELLKLATPSLVRGNQAEMGALSFPDGVVTLATGETDIINGVERISGGVQMLQTITATGCSQGAICAAFLGRGLSPLEAARAASKLMKQAGELAWRVAKTPGSFRVALLDALFTLTHT